jgi:hypothetical protein
MVFMTIVISWIFHDSSSIWDFLGYGVFSGLFHEGNIVSDCFLAAVLSIMIP